jgi:hypothetical protein
LSDLDERIHFGSQLAWRLRVPSWIVFGGAAWLIDPWLLPIGILVAELGWIAVLGVSAKNDRRRAQGHGDPFAGMSKRQRGRQRHRWAEERTHWLDERAALVRLHLDDGEALFGSRTQQQRGVYLTDRRLLLVSGAPGQPADIDELLYEDVRHWEWTQLHDGRPRLVLASAERAVTIPFRSLRDPSLAPMRKRFPPV